MSIRLCVLILSDHILCIRIPVIQIKYCIWSNEHHHAHILSYLNGRGGSCCIFTQNSNYASTPNIPSNQRNIDQKCGHIHLEVPSYRMHDPRGIIMSIRLFLLILSDHMCIYQHKHYSTIILQHGHGGTMMYTL